jgi:glycosyltransferase involved in cell wall biosynthesis
MNISIKKSDRKAIACISPGQAGLSVLSSMAYGVPFITQKDAITGGEIFNIKNGENGILYEGAVEQLSELLLDLSTDKEKVQKLSHNAQNYYFRHATMQIMVQGLSGSIEYALSKR